MIQPQTIVLSLNFITSISISKPTCYKNPDNPSCIDLILTNCPNYFQNSSTFETRLSDFHKLTLTLFKSEIHSNDPTLYHTGIISALIVRYLRA